MMAIDFFKLTDFKKEFLTKTVDIAPLIIFRIVFSLLMFFSLLRFWLNGWIEKLYLEPTFHFKYYGFSWVQSPEGPMMYLLFFGVIASSLMMLIGYKYRIASVCFFLGFTYLELIDKSMYLNHYYFVSLMAFILCFVPSNRYFSFDAHLNPSIQTREIQIWSIQIIKLQLGIVYFFAGIAKLNYDWLVRALPLKIWLPAHASKPLVGTLFKNPFMAYLFSWSGVLYDLLIPFFLLLKKTRPFAYVVVIGFHIITYWLFPIGMFPFIMISCSLIFFSEDFHKKILTKLEQIFNWKDQQNQITATKSNHYIRPVIMLFFLVQFALPFRYLFYNGLLFWHEQGYRFGWRVMLTEKAGSAVFFAKDIQTKQRIEIRNSDYLTPFQEKMMATQPDMILEFAHYIEKQLKSQGWSNPEIYADVFVTLNGSGSRRFIDANINLAEIDDSWQDKKWILPFNTNR